jgi:hypothetical protein
LSFDGLVRPDSIETRTHLPTRRRASKNAGGSEVRGRESIACRFSTCLRELTDRLSPFCDQLDSLDLVPGVSPDLVAPGAHCPVPGVSLQLSPSIFCCPCACWRQLPPGAVCASVAMVDPGGSPWVNDARSKSGALEAWRLDVREVGLQSFRNSFTVGFTGVAARRSMPGDWTTAGPDHMFSER